MMIQPVTSERGYSTNRSVMSLMSKRLVMTNRWIDPWAVLTLRSLHNTYTRGPVTLYRKDGVLRCNRLIERPLTIVQHGIHITHWRVTLSVDHIGMMDGAILATYHW